MPNIFSSEAGRVVQLVGGGLPMSIRIGAFDPKNIYSEWGGFNVVKSIITGISFQSQSGFQILHTLNGFIYIYSFGERSSDLSVNGLAFMANCSDEFDDSGLVLGQ